MLHCIVEGCNCRSYSQAERRLRGNDISTTLYCRKHYRWFKQNGSTEMPRHAHGTVEQRFWKFVDKTESCWLWNSGKNVKGYGVMQATPEKGQKRGKTLLAHRISYEIHHGKLEQGDCVLHSCDNPSCVNPAHLRKGTQSENIKEAILKGRKFVPIASGEANPRSKLTLVQAKFIKAHPELGHKHIADMFGLSPNCIRGVRIGRTWKDA